MARERDDFGGMDDIHLLQAAQAALRALDFVLDLASDPALLPAVVTGQRIPLQSSCLAAASYSLPGTLTLEFVKGGMWQYQAPLSVFRELLDAPSAGQYFNQAVRNTYPASEA